MKALQIIETAYRGTLEEQDDTIIWLTHSMRDAGAELSVLLTGNAVNYAVKGQDASGLSFGDWKQTNPPRIEAELEKLIGKGVPVYAVRDDIDRRGLGKVAKVTGVQLVARNALAALLEAHDLVWHW
ncbi:MAG: DsrE family protein [Parvibaculum sp.]|uniref:DsrE family protein n=1 Tax=Parvibaculum sp. TaxID=2024848 RepID=UPI00283FAFD7|nr:DsrE family protein [Parvibaculum sp.]MDR3499831.1 DsrE family protein [Parvibaculum sp.]